MLETGNCHGLKRFGMKKKQKKINFKLLLLLKKKEFICLSSYRAVEQSVCTSVRVYVCVSEDITRIFNK